MTSHILLQTKSNKQRCVIILRIPKIMIKNVNFFRLQYIRMSGKNINFNDKKKSKKAIFTKIKK